MQVAALGVHPLVEFRRVGEGKADQEGIAVEIDSFDKARDLPRAGLAQELTEAHNIDADLLPIQVNVGGSGLEQRWVGQVAAQ